MCKYTRIIVVLALALMIVSGAYASWALQQSDRRVWLGGTQLSPDRILVNGRATLNISIATSLTVPSVGANGSSPIVAVVTILETQNFGGISYSINRTVNIPLEGGGVSSTPNNPPEFVMDSRNTRTGTIVSRVTLERLENISPQLGVNIVTPVMTDVSLRVDSSPTPTPTPPLTQQECYAAGWYWNFAENRCSETPAPCPEQQYLCGQPWEYWDEWLCMCTGRPPSPVILDVSGNGFDLTDRTNGVMFDIDGNGTPEHTAWTASGSDDAWLFLDRNGNNRVDNGLELFGNFTVQPYSPTPNGFVALSIYDRPERGGNDDGVIDSRDSIFSSLRLWQDANHNGISEASEIKTLPTLGVAKIELDYRESRRRDRWGNEFRYRARVWDTRGQHVGRWAFDVFLTAP